MIITVPLKALKSSFAALFFKETPLFVLIENFNTKLQNTVNIKKELSPVYL